MSHPQDALGNDIVLGNKYGYSNSTSGRQTVVVGVATKVFAGKFKATLAVEDRKNFLYGEQYEPHVWADDKPSKTVTVLGCHLFPVN